MNYVIYCAFGDQKYVNEAIYSILSLKQSTDIYKNNIKVVIMSNKIDQFKQFFNNDENIIFENIPNSIMIKWLGGIFYMPRLKIKCLQYFIEKYNENVILIDTDTIIYSDINYLFKKISQNYFIMHSSCPSVNKSLELCNDYNYEDIPSSAQKRINLYKDIQENNLICLNNKEYNILPSFKPYNSGVLGINKNYYYLLNSILELSDILYKKYKFGCAEEFAFTYIIQNEKINEIYKCEEDIFHYCYAYGKPSRIFFAYVLNYFHKDDEQLFSYFLDNNKLNKELFTKFDLKIYDIPKFMYFVKNHLIMQNDYENPNNKPLDNIYFEEDSIFFNLKKDKDIQNKYKKILNEIKNK